MPLSYCPGGKLPKGESICTHVCYACQLNLVAVFLCSTINISTGGLNSTLSDHTSRLGPRFAPSLVTQNVLSNYYVQGTVLCYGDTDIKNNLSSKYCQKYV